MTSKKRLLQHLMLLLFLLLPACSSSSTMQETQTKSPSPIVQEITPSATFAQTRSTKPTLLPPLTQGMHPTMTHNLQSQFYDLLKDNGNCELPCFLGIEPQKTKLADARELIETFSINQPSGYDTKIGEIGYRLYSYSIKTNQEVNLHINIELFAGGDDLVQYIALGTSSYRNNELVGDDLHLSFYSLREIFQRLGAPDAIYLLPPKRGVYSIHVVYERLKMVIGFTGRANENPNGGYTVCPNFGD